MPETSARLPSPKRESNRDVRYDTKKTKARMGAAEAKVRPNPSRETVTRGGLYSIPRRFLSANVKTIGTANAR